jgi:hypothetical protein
MGESAELDIPRIAKYWIDFRAVRSVFPGVPRIAGPNAAWQSQADVDAAYSRTGVGRFVCSAIAATLRNDTVTQANSKVNL